MSFTAKQIPVDQAGSGWYEILPPPPDARILKQDLKADWVVVGAGFAGLSAAHRIRQQSPGDRVVVLDAQRIAWGASGRNSGFMIDLPHNLQSDDYSGQSPGEESKEIAMNRFAIDYARSMIEEFGLNEYVSAVGKINAATGQSGIKALESYLKHLEKHNEPFTRLDKNELKRMTGLDYYADGIHTPGCLLFQPAAYIRGIAGGIASDVAVYENSAVRKIETGKSNRVITANGSVQAKNMILTVNGQLESFGIYQKRFIHIFLYGSMTRELTKQEQQALGGESEWGITPAHPMGSTIRRIKENRIVVRNSITYNPERKSTDSQLVRAGGIHDRSFQRRFPMLPKVNMEYRWSGHLCLSLNSAFVFGEIEKGIYAACCQNGLGAAKGTLNGILLVDHIMGKRNEMINHVLNGQEPKKIYPEPFMSMGVKTHLWWGQKRAGRDV